MIDKGRWRICEEIAKNYPFSVDEIYRAYEKLREWKVEKQVVITLDSQLRQIKAILDYSIVYGIPPISSAIIFISQVESSERLYLNGDGKDKPVGLGFGVKDGSKSAK